MSDASPSGWPQWSLSNTAPRRGHSPYPGWGIVESIQSHPASRYGKVIARDVKLILRFAPFPVVVAGVAPQRLDLAADLGHVLDLTNQSFWIDTLLGYLRSENYLIRCGVANLLSENRIPAYKRKILRKLRTSYQLEVTVAAKSSLKNAIEELSGRKIMG